MLFVYLLSNAMIALGPTAIDLRVPVMEHISQSGVTHPVTAVLLNYRGYDTLLEVAVLLLALIAIFAVIGDLPRSNKKATHPVIQNIARISVPLMIVVAVYLLWAGAFKPGGAFQASAVLAAAGVLLYLVGLIPAWNRPQLHLRIALSGGFLFFLIIATALLWQGALLQYPPAIAGLLILLIESALTLSLALNLAGLFLFLVREDAN
jgi:multisubunit Na+/H+ antiporter MnhB subunit